jgi:aspartate/methionine/tyrosine aminotransferase
MSSLSRRLYLWSLIIVLFIGYRNSLIFRGTQRSKSSRLIVRDSHSECDLATEGTVSCNTESLQMPSSVWTVFGELAAKTGACNLGQGFPDWSPPQFVLDSLKAAVETPFHQYTRPAGHPPLVELLAARYSQHFDRNVDPFNEMAVTVGASQALYLALSSFLNANDEIVLFEPFFDLYLKQIKLTGATPKFVPLGGKYASLADPWALDIDALKK